MPEYLIFSGCSKMVVCMASELIEKNPAELMIGIPGMSERHRLISAGR